VTESWPKARAGAMRRATIAGRPRCQARVDASCTPDTVATVVHHIAPGAPRDHSASNLLAACDPCHRWIHANPFEARQRDLLRSRENLKPVLYQRRAK
jgi:hypothetical protein